MTTKRSLYQLVDKLPKSVWPEAERLLGSLLGDASRVTRVLPDAPWDDEPESEGERAMVEEAYEAIARGKVVSDEELDRELGW